MSAHFSRELAIKTRNGLMKRHEQHAFTGGTPPMGFRVVDDEGRKVLAVVANVGVLSLRQFDHTAGR